MSPVRVLLLFTHTARVALFQVILGGAACGCEYNCQSSGEL